MKFRVQGDCVKLAAREIFIKRRHSSGFSVRIVGKASSDTINCHLTARTVIGPGL